MGARLHDLPFRTRVTVSETHGTTAEDEGTAFALSSMCVIEKGRPGRQSRLDFGLIGFDLEMSDLIASDLELCDFIWQA